MTENIEILLQGCLEYDRLSQEKLYRHFYDDLFSLCRKFFDDEHDIITALNNGMLNAFNNIEKYEMSKGNLFCWVYGVVRNAAISHVRAKEKEIAYQEAVTEMRIETSINPFKDASEETVISFLRTLTSTTRAVFNLFYIEGFLIKEIAQCLDMKEGTVKWHLNDGRSKLKLIYNNNTNMKVYAK